MRRGTEPHLGKWTFPGGKVRFGERIREACAREILEETGLHVEVADVVEVYEALVPDTSGNLEFHYVIVDLLCHPRGALDVMPATDAADARWFEVADLKNENVTDGVPEVLQKAITIVTQ